jgi:hypothetical protein
MPDDLVVGRAEMAEGGLSAAAVAVLEAGEHSVGQLPTSDSDVPVEQPGFQGGDKPLSKLICQYVMCHEVVSKLFSGSL